MLPDATQRELERCLARLLVDTTSALVVLMSPTGHVFAWQGTGAYDALIKSRGSTLMPIIDVSARQSILIAPTPGSRRPREHGSWVAPDLMLWLLHTANPSQVQEHTLRAQTEIQAVLRRADLL